MAFLTRDDARLYYEDHGSGPAVLLTHGYRATSQMWRGQIAAFKDRYRIIVWDMRGHGETDYMAAKIPGAEKAVIRNAGHAANIDNPGDFNAAMGAFLHRLCG